jgi:GT2 family glycosyltransferase
MRTKAISTILVAHNSLADLEVSLPRLLAELRSDDELIVVDNHSRDGLHARLPELAPGARLLKAPGNLGFAGGANLGARAARSELLLFLNPDVRVAPGFADAIRAPLQRTPNWAAWMGLVTQDGGRTINTSGGVIHYTGLGWAGENGAPVESASTGPREVTAVSGACLAIPRSTWEALGGFSEEYFMYYEDTDLSLRLRLRGEAIGIEPDARVEHDYEFDKGLSKWRYLERNRWAMLLRCFPGPLLALLFPALVATELAIWTVALRGGWVSAKRTATADVLRSLPRLLGERRAIQSARRISSWQFAQALTDELSSPFLADVASRRAIRWFVSGYWAAVCTLLVRLSCRRAP